MCNQIQLIVVGMQRDTGNETVLKFSNGYSLVLYFFQKKYFLVRYNHGSDTNFCHTPDPQRKTYRVRWQWKLLPYANKIFKHRYLNLNYTKS